MADRSLPWKVAIHAVNGECEALIAEKLFKSAEYRPKIHYHIKKLVKDGVLRHIPGTRYPKQYTRGPNYWKFVGKYRQKLKNDGENGDHGGWVRLTKKTPNMHNLQYAFTVTKPPVKSPPWDKVWCPNNPLADTEALKSEPRPDPEAVGSDIHRIWRINPDTAVSQNKIFGKAPFVSMFHNTITVKEDIGRNRHTIMIMLHPEEFETKWELEQLHKVLTERAAQVASALAYAFGYSLDWRFNSGPHFAFPGVDKETVKIAKKYNLHTPELRFEESNGIPEVETNSFRVAKTLTELPDTMEDMQERIKELTGIVNELHADVQKYREFARASTAFNVSLVRLLDELVKAGQLDAETVRRYAERATDEQPDDGHPEGYA